MAPFPPSIPPHCSWASPPPSSSPDHHPSCIHHYPPDKDTPLLSSNSEYDDEDDDHHDLEDQQSRKDRPSRWMRGMAFITAFVAPRHHRPTRARLLLNPTPTPTPTPVPTRLGWQSSSRQFHRLKSLSRCLLYPVLGLLIMLGIIQFIAIACGIVLSFFSDELDRATERWRHGETGAATDILHWPTDNSRDIVPVACHSHNDYWRPVPLFSALQAGCVSVEADVWLMNNDLYVGHTVAALTPQRTLRDLYINPLLRILDQQNPITDFHPRLDQPRQGVFDTDPSQSLVLLIDFKTDGQEAWDHVSAQLSPLRENGYLTYFNGTDLIPGPITIVGTGNTPFNRVIANTTYRDIFFDAPLDKLADSDDPLRSDRLTPVQNTVAYRSPENVGQGLSGLSDADIRADTFDWTNSYFASVSFKKTIGRPWGFRLTELQVKKIRAQIRAAHRRGLKVRYWGVPAWPRSLRNHLWSILVREGVDLLNVDDLKSATRQDWRPKISDWWS